MEAIVAIDLYNGISKNGVIPWTSKKDMTHFYKKTTGNIVIMGKNTYFSIPEERRPLKNRLNIVLTTNPYLYQDISNSNVIFTNDDSIYNDFENIIALYDDGIKFHKKYNIGTEKGIDKYTNIKNYINIKLEFAMKNLISNFRVIYYK